MGHLHKFAKKLINIRSNSASGKTWILFKIYPSVEFGEKEFQCLNMKYMLLYTGIWNANSTEVSDVWSDWSRISWKLPKYIDDTIWTLSNDF